MQGAKVKADCEIPKPVNAGQYVADLKEVTLSAPVCAAHVQLGFGGPSQAREPAGNSIWQLTVISPVTEV